jgi:hypothetical protein
VRLKPADIIRRNEMKWQIPTRELPAYHLIFFSHIAAPVAPLNSGT